MKLSDPIKELLAIHEAFRKLNYPPEELFVATYAGGRIQFVLQHQGKQFTIDIAQGQDPAAIAEEWQKAVAWWNKEATEEERQAIYMGSVLLEHGGTVSLIHALVAKGVYPITIH